MCIHGQCHRVSSLAGCVYWHLFRMYARRNSRTPPLASCGSSRTSVTRRIVRHDSYKALMLVLAKVFADYFVFVIIFATLILWCPCGLFIVYKVVTRWSDARTALL